MQRASHVWQGSRSEFQKSCAACQARHEMVPNTQMWDVMSQAQLKEWMLVLQARERDDLNALVRRGIPRGFRASVWPVLLGVEESNESIEELVAASRADGGDETVLDLDVTRMGAELEREREEVRQLCCAVLRDYPYKQGDGFMAQELLAQMPLDGTAVGCMRVLLGEGRLQGPGVEVWGPALEGVLAERLPELGQRLAGARVDQAAVVVGPWLRTAYAGFLEQETVGRVWDLWLVHGFDVLLRVACVLLERALPGLGQLTEHETLAALGPAVLAERGAAGWTAQQLVEAALDF